MEKRGIASFFGHKKVDRDNDVQQTIATKVRTATTMGDDREDHDNDGDEGEDCDNNGYKRRGP